MRRSTVRVARILRTVRRYPLRDAPAYLQKRPTGQGGVRMSKVIAILALMLGAALALFGVQNQELVARMRQDSERSQARERVSLRWVSSDRAYAACSNAHTSPQRSWNKRRCSAKDTVSFRRWR